MGLPTTLTEETINEYSRKDFEINQNLLNVSDALKTMTISTLLPEA
jgi:hypothetical protein